MSGDQQILERLEELESQLAFQDELHEQLNDIVARQDREIALLKAQLADLAMRMKEVADSTAGQPSDPASEVPPHY